MKIAIISYDRADRQDTLSMLRRIGAPREDITIFLNSKDDYIGYKKYMPEVANVVCVEKPNVSGNCNTVLNSLSDGEFCLLLDDDVKKIVRWEQSKKASYGAVREITYKELVHDMNGMEKVMQKYGMLFFGVAPLGNPLIMSNFFKSGGELSYNKIFQGGLLGIRKGHLHFDENVAVLSDYDFFFNCLSHGVPTLRNNLYHAVKRKNEKTKGGTYDLISMGYKEKTLFMLKSKYPNLLTLKKDLSGVRVSDAVPKGDMHWGRTESGE